MDDAAGDDYSDATDLVKALVRSGAKVTRGRGPWAISYVELAGIAEWMAESTVRLVTRLEADEPAIVPNPGHKETA